MVSPTLKRHAKEKRQHVPPFLSVPVTEPPARENRSFPNAVFNTVIDAFPENLNSFAKNFPGYNWPPLRATERNLNLFLTIGRNDKVTSKK